MKEEKIKVMMVKVGTDPYITEIDNNLPALQGTVGGYIECISPFSDMEVDLVCNEEGKLQGLTPNRYLIDKATNKVVDLLVGDFFLCSSDNEGNFASLSDEQIKKIKSQFRVTASAVWFQ